MSLARRAFQSPIAFAALAIVAIAITWLFVSGIGAYALALGVVGTGFNVLAIKWMIGLAAQGAKADVDARNSKRLAILVVMAFFVKLPILILLGLYVQTLGNVALPCFLWGLGLVYFALVGWATATSQT